MVERKAYLVVITLGRPSDAKIKEAITNGSEVTEYKSPLTNVWQVHGELSLYDVAVLFDLNKTPEIDPRIVCGFVISLISGMHWHGFANRKTRHDKQYADIKEQFIQDLKATRVILRPLERDPTH